MLRKKLNDNNRFDFEFKTNLIVSKDNNGNLNFKDDLDKSVFVMPKGCMWDSNGEYSSDNLLGISILHLQISYFLKKKL